MRQFDPWIGGGHWFWLPRRALLAERGGREGGQEKEPMRQFDPWIGGGHRFWHPRRALHAERGGREGAPGAPAPSPAWTWLPRVTPFMTRAVSSLVVLKRIVST